MSINDRHIREQMLYEEISRLEERIEQLKSKTGNDDKVAVVFDESEWDYYIFHMMTFQSVVVKEFVKRVCEQLVKDPTKGNEL